LTICTVADAPKRNAHLGEATNERGRGLDHAPNHRIGGETLRGRDRVGEVRLEPVVIGTERDATSTCERWSSGELAPFDQVDGMSIRSELKRSGEARHAPTDDRDDRAPAHGVAWGPRP
jgi:hypothetical protein